MSLTATFCEAPVSCRAAATDRRSCIASRTSASWRAYRLIQSLAGPVN